MQEILERLGEVERVNIKLKKKDEDKFTFTKKVFSEEGVVKI